MHKLIFCYLVASAIAGFAWGTTIRSMYGNGCAFVPTEDELVSLYDPEHLKAPFVNCSHLSLSSIDFKEFDQSIRSLGLDFNSLTTFHTNDVMRFEHLGLLSIGHNRISSITATITNGTKFPSVSTIFLGFNLLTEIPTNIFKSFKTLSSLSLVENEITAIKPTDFDFAKSLMVLNLGSNPLKTIDGEAFFKMQHLIALDMTDCQLTEYPTFLGNMTRLLSLLLGHNHITSLGNNVLYNNTALRFLGLPLNKIKTIHQSAFLGAPKLVLVHMSGNQLSTLPEGLFHHVEDEKAGFLMEFYDNPIRCDCTLLWLKNWFESIKTRGDILFTCAQPLRNRGKQSYNLTDSDLTCSPDDTDWTGDDNQVCPGTTPTVTKPPHDDNTQCPDTCTCYHADGSQYHPSTETIPLPRGRRWRDILFPYVDCTNANLTEFPRNLRTDVKAVRLRGNAIETFDISSLKLLTSLQTLKIEGCGLKTLTESYPIILPNLTSLSLINNELTTLTSVHLRSFPNLKTLSINHNKFKSLPKDLFMHNFNLQRLYIGPNPTTEFYTSSLNNLNLISLSLRNMSLKKIPTINSKNLTYLELSDNLIKKISNNSFTKNPSLVRLDLEHNQIATLEVNAFKGASSLTFLDLSQNNLTYIPPGVFDNMRRERMRIELWRNRIYCDCKMRWFLEFIAEVEDEDPMTEIRFTCMKPWRIHARTSNDLSPEDLICETSDPRPDPTEDIEKINEDFFEKHQKGCYTSGQIVLTIFLTMLFTLLALFVLRWFCTWRKRNKRYAKPEDISPLEMDM